MVNKIINKINSTQKKLKLIKLIRVSYGKQNTPKSLREYHLAGFSTVGTLSDFKMLFPDTEFIIVDEINKKEVRQ